MLPAASSHLPYRFTPFYGPAIPQKGAYGRVLQLYMLGPTADHHYTGSSHYDDDDDDDDGVSHLIEHFGAASVGTDVHCMRIIEAATKVRRL